MKKFNKINVSANGQVSIDTPNGKFVIEAGNERGYNEIFVSFQRDEENAIDQSIFHCEERDGVLTVHLWKDPNSEDITDTYDMKAVSRDNSRKVFNIQWDTDDDEEVLESLPTEVEIPSSVDYDDDDAVNDYLSDTYGFCVFGWCRKG